MLFKINLKLVHIILYLVQGLLKSVKQLMLGSVKQKEELEKTPSFGTLHDISS